MDGTWAHPASLAKSVAPISYSFSKYILSTHHELGTVFYSGDTEIKNWLPTLRGPQSQWRCETVPLWALVYGEIGQAVRPRQQERGQSAEAKEIWEHSRCY